MNSRARWWPSRTLPSARCRLQRLRLPLSGLVAALLSLPLLAGPMAEARAQAAAECTAANADGSYTVPGDWALNPPGLASGATFRLLFVTSTTRNADTADIATYNTFVQDRAKAGHSAISDSCGNLFKVVGSTMVNAYDNTATTGTGMPIYWLNGDKVADHYSDFYDGSWDSISARDESGNSLSSVNRVWTGTSDSGARTTGFLGRANQHISFGLLSQNRPLFFGATDRSNNYPFYGLSPVFTVGPSGLPTVTLSGRHTIEEGETTLINVRLSAAAAAQCRVRVRARRADGTLWSTTAVIAAGGRSGRATVEHNDDDIWHRGGYFDMPVWVVPGDCYEGPGESDATYVIRVKDNDQISASFSGPGNVDSEEFSREQLTAVTFSPNPGRGNLPAVLNFKVSGTATEGVDYAFASTVTRNGDVYTSSGTGFLGERVIGLDFIDDDVNEGTETIVLTLEPGVDYVVDGEDNQQTLEILDDEAPTTIYTLSLDASPLSADEGDPNRDRLVTFAMTPAPTSSHPVNFMACFTGTASRGVDYQITDVSNSGTKIVLRSTAITGQPGCQLVMVYPGASSGSFKVRVSRDANFEADETVTITLKPLSGDMDLTDTPGAFAVSGTAGSVELVIVNDDEDPSLPAIFFDPARRSRAENVGTENLEIFSSRALASALTVNYSLSGTATCGTDYTITGADCTAGTGDFTFPANTAARTPVPFPITVIDDDISDNGETIIVTLTSTSADGYWLPPGFTKTFTLTLYDDTGAAAISVSGTPRVGARITINWDSDDPDGNGSGDPYYYWQFRATSSDDWSDSQARQRGCVQRATTCRPTHSAGNPTVGGYFRGLVRYTDGNGLGTTVHTAAIGPFTAAVPGIVLPATDVTLREGRTASYNLKLATDPGAGATVRVSITSGNAGAVTVNDTQSGVNGTQNHLDFTGGSGGSWNTHQAVTVRGVQDADTTNEAGVTLTHAVSVQAGSSAPYTGLADVTLNVDVTDDDTLPPPGTPVVSITASPSSMTEGGTITFTLTADPAPTQNITVVINFSAGVRFTGVGRLTRFIDTSGTRTFTVVTYNDNRDEASGPVTATVGTGTGYVPHITEGSATVIVNDNDDPPPNRPVVSIGVSPSSMTEGDAATFTLTASPAPTASIAVGVQVRDSGDFAGAAAGLHTVSIPSSGTASFTVPTTDDGTDEPNGTITATVNTGTGYSTHNTEWSASATVNDNDDPGSTTPVVSIEGSPSSMTEGGTATFTLTASPAPTGSVSVAVAVAGGSFAAGGTRTVTVGASGTATFTVPTTDDAADEPNGTITATVNAGTGYAPHGTEGSASVTVNDNDDPDNDDPGGGNPGGGSGGGGGGGSGEVVRIFHAEPVAEGFPLRFRVALESPARRRLDLLAATAPGTATERMDYLGFSRRPVTVQPGVSELWLAVPTARDADDGEGEETLTVTLSVAPGSARASVVRHEARGAILDGPPPEAVVPFLPADAEARHGFVRVLDRGWLGGTVTVSATDGGGVSAESEGLRLPPGGAAHFNSRDLELGSAAKGLGPGTGLPTRGHWRLRLSGADLAALAYARAADGFVTPLSGTLPAEADGGLFAAFFNPGSNWRQVSLLRLRNPGEGDALVTVVGTDDSGASPGTPVNLTLPGGESVMLTAAELERGAAPGVDLDGALGDGQGKWRLSVSSDRPIEAMSLLESPTGHLANLSAATAPRTEAGDGTARTLVPLFPSASDPDRRQGFLRVVNRGAEEAEVRIEAVDDAGTVYPAVTLAVEAGQAVHLNSHDLENGAPRKGLPKGAGPGGGHWRLEAAAPSAVVVLAYLRHLDDGFVTGMNALAPFADGAHRVDFLNPGSNWRQVGLLRLMNPGPELAQVTVAGADDAGASPGVPVTLTLPAHEARTLAAAELEAGGEGLEGALGDGRGKWRLRVESDRPIRVMSLLESPTGHLANLSAGFGGGTAEQPGTQNGAP